MSKRWLLTDESKSAGLKQEVASGYIGDKKVPRCLLLKVGYKILGRESSQVEGVKVCSISKQGIRFETGRLILRLMDEKMKGSWTGYMCAHFLFATEKFVCFKLRGSWRGSQTFWEYTLFFDKSSLFKKHQFLLCSLTDGFKTRLALLVFFISVICQSHTSVVLDRITDLVTLLWQQGWDVYRALKFWRQARVTFPSPPPTPQNEIFGYQPVARNSRMLYFHWLLD